MPVLLYDIALRAHASLQARFPQFEVYQADQANLIAQAGKTRLAVEIALEPSDEQSNDIPVGVILRVYIYQPLKFVPPKTGQTDIDYAKESDYFHALDIVHDVMAWAYGPTFLNGLWPMDLAGYLPGTFPVGTGQNKEYVHILEFISSAHLDINHRSVLTGSIPTPPSVIYVSGGEGPPIQRISITYKVGDSEETKVVYEA